MDDPRVFFTYSHWNGPEDLEAYRVSDVRDKRSVVKTFSSRPQRLGQWTVNIICLRQIHLVRSLSDLRTMLRPLSLGALLLPLALLAQPDADDHLKSAQAAYKAEDYYATALAHADSALVLEASIPGGYKLRGDIKQRQLDFHGAMMDYVSPEKLNRIRC